MQNNAMQFLDLRRIPQEYPICRRKAWQLIRDGRLAAFRLDGKLIVKRADIERLLTAKRANGFLDQLVEETVSEVLR
jgi:hypothetical protein